MTLVGFMAWQWSTSDGIGPQMYSWYHIMWLIIMIGLSVGAVIYGRKIKDQKVVDRNVLILDCALIISEILKQIMYHVGYYGYLRIDVLPFSFCSIPMFVALVASLAKNEKIKNACYGFLAFYGIVGGLTSMLYPVTLYTSLVYTSIQTMFWHTSLVVMAVYIIVTKEYGKSFIKEILPPFVIFAACSLIAIGLNELSYHAYLEPRQTPTCEVDRTPGSYQYYKYGFQSGEDYYYLDDVDGELVLTKDYRKAVNVVITYPEGDNYTIYLLGFEDDGGNDKYIEISPSNELVLVDNPTNNWEFVWITGDRAVFAMNVSGETYCLSMENGSLQVAKTADYDETSIFADFIDGHVLSDGDSANFFFISNHCETPIPLLNLVQPHVPYVVFVLIYVAGFFGLSSAAWGLAYLSRKLAKK